MTEAPRTSDYDFDIFDWIQAKDMAPWPGLNARRRFDPAKHSEMVESIRRHGIRQPLAVHDRGPGVDGARFWIVAGERRHRAAIEIGPETYVPAMVRTYLERDALEVVLIENLDRDDLSPIEEARGFQRLLEQPGMTQRKLAERIGRSQPHIANRIRMLELPDEVLELVEDGVVEMTHARDLLLPFAKIPDAKRTKLYAQCAKKLKSASKNGLSEHNVQHIVGEVALSLSDPVGQGGHGDKEPEFDAKEHAKCTCQGPKFAYSWNSSVRCFDDAWWSSAQQKAIDKRKAAEEKAAAKLAEKAAAGEVTVMGDDAFRKKYGWNSHGLGRSNDLVDASLLADAPVVIVKSRYSGPEVHCMDDAALRRARSKVTKEKNQLVAQRKAERTAKERAEASGAQLEPWMLAEFICERPMMDTVIDVARELDLPIAKRGQRGEVDASIRKLPAADIELLFKVLALRSKRKELSYRDPIVEDVEKQLRRKYTPGITALKKRALAAAGIDAKVNVPDPDHEDVEDSDVEAECVVCGCTDEAACSGGCSWLAVNRKVGAGVCSSCAATKEEAEATLAEHLSELGVGVDEDFEDEDDLVEDEELVEA